MSKKPYSETLLRQFDRLTHQLSSRDQMTRIEARLKINGFVAKHGKTVCDEMFEELIRRDNQ